MKIDIDDYEYLVAWSEEDQAYVARVKEFKSLSAHADTMDDAYRELLKVVAATVKFLEEDGDEIPKPKSRIIPEPEGGGVVMFKMKTSYNGRRMFDRKAVYKGIASSHRVFREADYGRWKPLDQIDKAKETLVHISNFIDTIDTDKTSIKEYLEESITTLKEHTDSSGELTLVPYHEPLISLTTLVKKIVKCIKVLDCEFPYFDSALSYMEDICEWLGYDAEKRVHIHEMFRSMEPVLRNLLISPVDRV